jgi:hypothetical protein
VVDTTEARKRQIARLDGVKPPTARKAMALAKSKAYQDGADAEATLRARPAVAVCEIGINGAVFPHSRRPPHPTDGLQPGNIQQRILQTFGQGDETFSAKHDPNMLPTGEGQAEVVEPVLERTMREARYPQN